MNVLGGGGGACEILLLTRPSLDPLLSDKATTRSAPPRQGHPLLHSALSSSSPSPSCPRSKPPAVRGETLALQIQTTTSSMAWRPDLLSLQDRVESRRAATMDMDLLLLNHAAVEQPLSPPPSAASNPSSSTWEKLLKDVLGVIWRSCCCCCTAGGRVCHFSYPLTW